MPGQTQIPAAPPAPPGVGSCDVNAQTQTCTSPVAPATIVWTDASVPAAGNLYYYLGDTFTTAGGVNRIFGPYGPTRVGSTPGSPAGTVGVRTATIDCP